MTMGRLFTEWLSDSFDWSKVDCDSAPGRIALMAVADQLRVQYRLYVCLWPDERGNWVGKVRDLATGEYRWARVYRAFYGPALRDTVMQAAIVVRNRMAKEAEQ